MKSQNNKSYDCHCHTQINKERQTRCLLRYNSCGIKPRKINAGSASKSICHRIPVKCKSIQDLPVQEKKSSRDRHCHAAPYVNAIFLHSFCQRTKQRHQKHASQKWHHLPILGQHLKYKPSSCSDSTSDQCSFQQDI